MLSFQGGIRVPAYTASKSAVMGLTKALANEWASKGIQVNAIAPGSVSYTHLRAHETDSYLVCRLLLEKKKILNTSPSPRERVSTPASITLLLRRLGLA